MDNRLIFAVLLVTLCWFSMGTYAQTTVSPSSDNSSTSNSSSSNDTSTAMPNTDNTTASSDSAMATTMSPSNATSGSNTTMSNATSDTATTPSDNNTMSNATSDTATTPSDNNTMSNATSATATTATTPTSNTTMSNTMPTETPMTTGTPPLTPNITVEALQANLSREACGTTQLCASEPASCDPSASNCFFFSARQQAGNNFDIGLSGESTGYIAATLSTDSTLGGNDTTYVCANNNGVVQFIPALLNNGALTSVPESDSSVNSVRGQVIGSIIQCTFAATVPSSVTRTTNLLVSVSTGTFNSSSGALGNPVARLQSSSVDLTNNNVSNVNNEISGSMSNSLTFKQSLTQVLLVVAGMMGLALL